MADPSPNDVLSGRGVSYNRHPGNEHFRTLLDAQSVRNHLRRKIHFHYLGVLFFRLT